MSPEGVTFAWAGTLSPDTPQAPDPDTLFEIGSVTKLFTAILLADSVQRGIVKLDDAIGAPFPASGITYRQLITHTSGLPRLPSDFIRGDLGNPYAEQDLGALVESFTLHAASVKPGKAVYSNLAVAILGSALAGAEGTAWVELVRTRVLVPLRLKATSTAWRDADARKLAPGLSPHGRAANWDLAAYSPAGGLVSSARDLAFFCQVALGLVETPVNARIAETMRALVPGEYPNQHYGMAWRIEKQGGSEVVWHSGATGGYRSFLGVHPSSRTAIVVLTNATVAPEPLGLHLLAGRALPAVPRTQPPAAALVPLLGNYPLSPSLVITVTAEGNEVFGQATAQGRIRFQRLSTDRYRASGVPGEIEFRRAENGKDVIALVLHQQGIAQTAPRLAPGTLPNMPPELTLTSSEVDHYTGKYRLEDAELTITRRGDRLFAQLTAQPRARIFPEAKDRFFYKDVGARLTFHADGEGRITDVTLHQYGRDLRAGRVP